MKKIFQNGSARQSAQEIFDWIEEKTLTEDNLPKVDKPLILVEIFDQDGNQI